MCIPFVDDKCISVGDIALLQGYGNDKFLVCRGWYMYQDSRRNGWYFKRIPDGKVVPDFEVDLSQVVIVASERHECPPGPSGRPGPPVDKDANVEACFTTVNTIGERNNICRPFPPDGKIVRVNNVKGEARYYIWDAEEFIWKDFEFPTSATTLQDIKDLDSKVTNIQFITEWKYMSDIMTVKED